jgi:hypothetical protein
MIFSLRMLQRGEKIISRKDPPKKLGGQALRTQRGKNISNFPLRPLRRCEKQSLAKTRQKSWAGRR